MTMKITAEMFKDLEKKRPVKKFNLGGIDICFKRFSISELEDLAYTFQNDDFYKKEGMKEISGQVGFLLESFVSWNLKFKDTIPEDEHQYHSEDMLNSEFEPSREMFLKFIYIFQERFSTDDIKNVIEYIGDNKKKVTV